MASKQRKRRYRELRRAGLRKKVAKRLSTIGPAGHADPSQREAIARLYAAVSGLRDSSGMANTEHAAAEELLEVGDIRDVSVRG